MVYNIDFELKLRVVKCNLLKFEREYMNELALLTIESKFLDKIDTESAVRAFIREHVFLSKFFFHLEKIYIKFNYV